jgi:ABC-type sugar transport system ATPase subunit
MTNIKRKPQTPVRSTRLLAESIASNIMTAGGTNQKAWRLALKDRKEREMCGWCEGALAARIEAIIKANSRLSGGEKATDARP